MNSPFVRRHRLAAELRALRRERGMTAEQLSRLLHMSRMKISKLENARIRPNVGEVMNILDCLEVNGDKRHEIIDVTRDAAQKGWWTSFGATMNSRQRLLADVESGATSIREYNQSVVPDVLQTRDYTCFVTKKSLHAGESSFTLERSLEAQLRRQTELLATKGPRYEVIIDEIVVRRPTAPLEVMGYQFRHLIELATRHPRITLRLVPLAADFSGNLPPKSAFSIYTYPDPNDPAIAIINILDQEIVHCDAENLARYCSQYEVLQKVALSAAASLGLLTDIASEAREEG